MLWTLSNPLTLPCTAAMVDLRYDMQAVGTHISKMVAVVKDHVADLRRTSTIESRYSQQLWDMAKHRDFDNWDSRHNIRLRELVTNEQLEPTL